MSQSIEEAIKQAQQNAGNIAQDANANLGNGAVATYQQPGAVAQKGAPIGFDDLNSGTLNVSGWLKLSKFGMTIGADQTVFDEFDVVIPFDEVGYCRSVRFGNPAQYRKTYDNVTDSRGGSWVQTMMEAKKVDPSASEFSSADIPFYPLEDIVNKKGDVLINKGEAMGHSLSVTAWRGFAGFVTQLQRQGIDTNRALVKIKLGFVARKNSKGEWGEFTYNSPEVVDQLP